MERDERVWGGLRKLLTRSFNKSFPFPQFNNFVTWYNGKFLCKICINNMSVVFVIYLFVFQKKKQKKSQKNCETVHIKSHIHPACVSLNCRRKFAWLFLHIWRDMVLNAWARCRMEIQIQFICSFFSVLFAWCFEWDVHVDFNFVFFTF